MKSQVIVQQDALTLTSTFLEREVLVDFYYCNGIADTHQEASVLLVNDGQDLVAMDFAAQFSAGISTHTWPTNLLVVGIHAGPLRKMEYGMINSTDYLGRGDKAGLYAKFILEELLPLVKNQTKLKAIKEIGFAGFSLGGLSALDIAWNNAAIFSKIGVFSGALWWRSIEQESPLYKDELHRLMHNQIKKGSKRNNLQFFFQCGTLDEKNDRNKNGIIDSIDDTQDLIKELKLLGYTTPSEVFYQEIDGGKHDIATWKIAWPAFIKWAYMQ
jgi:enterochelin esterase-like enzyme